MWEPGDIVIMEQLLTLHKRVLKDPAMMEDRILHRYSFDM
jgi:alpha-ketoglutarate-dependent taurine dioxygenase